MERVPVPNFVGGSNILTAPNASFQQTVNFFSETTSPYGKTQRYLRATEGLKAFYSIPDVDTSCLFYQDGRAFGVTGTIFWEGFDNGTIIIRGAVPYSGTPNSAPATMASNGSAGNQVCIVSASVTSIFNTLTNVFTSDVLTGVDAQMVEFMDGYFFILVGGSRQVRFSDLEDGLTWPGLNVFERSWGSDNISFIKRVGRALFVVGTLTGEVWADNGNANTPFAPIQGVFLDQGCIGPFSAVRDGESIIWMNQDERGGGLIVRAKGYQPTPVSTYSVNLAVQAGPAVIPSHILGVSFVHQLEGHLFYWLQIDGLTPTPVFDLTENEWAQRGMWNTQTASYDPHIARCHAYAYERHLIGERASGIVYELSPKYFTDGVYP